MVRSGDPSAPLTPMMQQYFSVKEKYPEEIIFFRMGDFYEMFFDDAHVASSILGIALTSRSKDKDAIPMAGVPVRAVDSYLPKLLRAGKRVAICEQVQDPRDARGLVDREVVRVISPGTITDEKLIGEKANNFILGILPDGGAHGTAWVDLTTGEFRVWETTNWSALAARIGQLAPAECVLPESVAFTLDGNPRLQAILDTAFLTPFPDPLFERQSAYRTLTEHFSTSSLEGFGCEHLVRGVRAAGGLLRYLEDTQKVALKHITRLRTFQEGRVLQLDRATTRALELTETMRSGERSATLVGAFDRTATALGGRKLREWLLSPLVEVEPIRRRQDAVGELLGHTELRDRLHERLREVHDLERICSRISYGSANARDLVALRRSLEAFPELRELLASAKAEVIVTRAARLDDIPELRDVLSRALVPDPPLGVREGGLIAEGYHQELDELRSIGREGRQWIARFQHSEAERTGITSLKVGFNKVFGYYIEVTHAHREKVPSNYTRKQTLKNAERYVTPELKEYENKVLHARERATAMEYELLCDLRDLAASHIVSIQDSSEALAELDVLACFAGLARERSYVRPDVDESRRLHIEDGRHPVVEEVATTEPFIPNTVDLDDDHNIMIITGPNMAGKSTYIRQVALLTLLAQTGSFIPAKRAAVGVIDRLFTRVGSGDDLARGQSTFMVEMNETANILNNATRRSLIVLDEVGRGTSTFDGVSLAWAITEHIAEHIGARTLFATHYHELTGITKNFSHARNYNFAVKEWNETIIFLRKVVEGASDKSYGIHVARLAGIPEGVIERAKEVLANLENQSLDIHDEPALARKSLPRRSPPGQGATSPERAPLQLDFFHSLNEELLKELKHVDVDNMTPMEALQYLEDLRRRIV